MSEPGGVSAVGSRSVAIGRDISGVVTTGDYAAITSFRLGPLRPVNEVPAAPRLVGVPSVGVFVGREDALARLDAALSHNGVVVVHGLGGIGKSTLAARYAVERVAAFTQVVWVTAESSAELQAGLAGFAVALEPQLSGLLSVEALVERALGWLATHEGWLLVLDNVADPGLVRDLVSRVGSGRVVATSRRSTGWAGIAQPLALDVLPLGAARELVALIVGSDGAGLLAGVDELCARLGFLPLAVEQAAAFMAQNRVSAGEYLELLDVEPAGMFADTAEGVAPQRAVARVWAVSLDALADEPLCGAVLRVLAWLSPDGVPRDLLFGLADARQVMRALGRLTAYSMLSLDQAGAIMVHRLVQEVARTPEPGDRYRDPALIEQARLQADSLLYDALPGDPRDPAQWPRWRMLAIQVAAFTGYTSPSQFTRRTAIVLDRVAAFLHDQGAFGQSIEYLLRALAHNEEELGPEHPETLASRNNLALGYYAAGDYARAIELLERTLTDRERLLGPEHPETLASRNNLALGYYAAGDYARAIELLERTLNDSERLLGPDHPATLTYRNALANAYRAVGDYARAIELLERTLTDRERLLGPEHPDTLASRSNLAETYYSVGHYAQAIELLERTLNDSERLLGPEHPATLTYRNNLARGYYAAEDYARAIELLERTLNDSERLLGPEHPETLVSRNSLANAYRAVGNHAQAIELLERTLNDRKRVLGPEHPETLTSRNNLAETYYALGNHAQAIELLEQTLIDRERLLGAEHPDTLAARRELNSWADRVRELALPSGTELIPIAVYLEEDANHEVVRAAVEAYLYAAGLQLAEEDEPVIGSWWWTAKARKRTSEAAENIPVLAETMAWGAARSRQADNNLTNSQAAVNLLNALVSTGPGVIYIGSLLAVYDGKHSMVVNLSPVQVNELERRPALLWSPESVLEHLGFTNEQRASSQTSDAIYPSPAQRP